VSLADLLDRLPIPIVQAPMVGASDGRLALAAAQAGALGTLALGATPPDEIGPAVEAQREAVDAPVAANLFINRPANPATGEVEAALARLAPWYERIGAPLPELPNSYAPDFARQLDALIEARPDVASFTFDILTEDEVARVHAAGILVVGTANTVAEARAWAAIGADGICAQGAEAGGHHGYFLADIEQSVVGTLPLTATVVAAVELPVITAGGIMDGRGVAAALALGAKAAQMGTAFLLSDQATTPAPWRQAVEAAPDDPTMLTRAFSGRYARGLENRFTRDMRAVESDVPAYPVQNRLTQPLRAAATKAGEADLISLWAGQAVRLARRGDAGDMIRAWWAEAQVVARDLAVRTGAGQG
jgi:nitronate monooxygenase